MPAITSLAIAGGKPAVRALAGLIRKLRQLLRAVKHRHEAAVLGRLDDRMLADIGITRSDVRDAYSGSIWNDPTDSLARRAAERRMSRRSAAFERTTSAASGQPAADRPACFLM